MKKVIISFLFFLSFLNVSAQETTTPTLSKEAYLKKSNAEKTAAWLLLAGSTGLLVGSAATYELTWFGNSTADNTTSTFLGMASLGTLVASIVNFSSARENKKKLP